MTARISYWAVAAVCVVLVGCQHRWEPEPEFGVAVRNLAAAQYVNPDAPRGNRVVTGMDGPAAQASIEAYQESFKNPVSENLGSVIEQ